MKLSGKKRQHPKLRWFTEVDFQSLFESFFQKLVADGYSTYLILLVCSFPSTIKGVLWVYEPPSSRIPGQGWRLVRRCPNNWDSWHLRTTFHPNWMKLGMKFIMFQRIFKGTIKNCLCKYVYICVYIYICNCISFEISLKDTHSQKMENPPHSDLDPGSSRHPEAQRFNLCSFSFAAIRHLAVSVHVCAMSASGRRRGPGVETPGSFGLHLPRFEDRVPTKLAKC